MIHPIGDFLFHAMLISGGILLAWFAWLGYRECRRKRAVQQLRGSLSTFTNTFGEGRSFENAIAILADLGPHPLGNEFRQLQSLVNRGVDKPDLIAEFLRRFPCHEAEYLAAAMSCFPHKPEQVSSCLVRLDQIRAKRESARKSVVSACASSRIWIRGLLLAGPLGLTTIVLSYPDAFRGLRSKLAGSSAALLMIGGLFIVAVWFVLILQKQDESESVLD